jgi:hypothetical protein
MDQMTIVVCYSCPLCGLSRVTCTVPAREDHEEVIAWMDATVLRLGADHHARSPHCHPPRLMDVMIPWLGDGPIGGPTTH